MFKKTEPEDPQVQPVFPPRTPSPQIKERALIGPSIQIKGDLTGEEDLVIQGRVEGKIDLKHQNVTVGKSGHVKADIYGKTISVEGEVQGNLYGEDQLILRQSGTVRGNIVAPRVILEDGSNFKGSIDMTPKSAIDSSSSPAIRSEARDQISAPPASERASESTQSTGTGLRSDRGSPRN